MAIIPGGQQIRTTSADVDLTNRGNSLVQAQNQVYTMDDIVETVNADAGGSDLPYSSTIMKVTQVGSDTPIISFLLNEIGISFVSIFKSTGQISLNMTPGTYPSDEDTMFIVGDFHNGFYGASGLAAGVHNGQTLYLRTYGVDNAGALQPTDLGAGGTESIIIELRDFS